MDAMPGLAEEALKRAHEQRFVAVRQYMRQGGRWILVMTGTVEPSTGHYALSYLEPDGMGARGYADSRYLHLELADGSWDVMDAPHTERDPQPRPATFALLLRTSQPIESERTTEGTTTELYRVHRWQARSAVGRDAWPIARQYLRSVARRWRRDPVTLRFWIGDPPWPDRIEVSSPFVTLAVEFAPAQREAFRPPGEPHD